MECLTDFLRYTFCCLVVFHIMNELVEAVCASDGTNRLTPAGWHCQSWHSLQPFYTLTHQFRAPFCEGPAFIQIQFQTIEYLLMGVMTTNHCQHIVFYVISGISFEKAGI